MLDVVGVEIPFGKMLVAEGFAWHCDANLSGVWFISYSVPKGAQTMGGFDSANQYEGLRIRRVAQSPLNPRPIQPIRH